jgi:hypothetical protein
MPDTPSPAGFRASASVRARFAEALARRAAAHTGAARSVLDARLAALSDKIAVAGETTPVAAVPRPLRGPLAELVAQALHQKTTPVLGAATRPRDATPNPPAAGPAADPKTLQFFKRTWSRLSADQRLAQSRASLPENAGPLNSQHLVHRALTLMQQLSPEYLERFVGYIDASQWLEQANEAAAAEATAGPRSAGPRRSAALRRG